MREKEKDIISILGRKEKLRLFLTNYEDLKIYSASLEFEFEKVEKNLNGTYKIIQVLWEYLDLQSEEQCLYQLGCLIYHQLLYEPNLRADFEG